MSFKVYGPYVGKDGRSRLVVHSKDEVTSISYPRHVMDGQLGKTIPATHDVHHKDLDHSNNSKDNLELKEKVQHLKDHYPFTSFTMNCIWCGKPILFTRQKAKNRRDNEKRGKLGPFCSRICSGKYGKFEQLRRDSKLNAVKFGETSPSGNAEPSPLWEGVET